MHNDHILRFAKYQGTLRVEKAIDLLTGRVIELYVCFNCKRPCGPATDDHCRLIEDSHSDEHLHILAKGG